MHSSNLGSFDKAKNRSWQVATPNETRDTNFKNFNPGDHQLSELPLLDPQSESKNKYHPNQPHRCFKYIKHCNSNWTLYFTV